MNDWNNPGVVFSNEWLLKLNVFNIWVLITSVATCSIDPKDHIIVLLQQLAKDRNLGIRLS